MGARSSVVVVGILLLLGAGCQPSDACRETSTACGGDPVGAWLEDDSCQDPVLPDTTITKRTYRGQSVVPTGQVPPEPTSTDWCSELALGMNRITTLSLPRDTAKIQGAYLTYSAPGQTDHTTGFYTAFITSSDRAAIEYSKTCLERFGYSTSCAQFAELFAAYAAGLGGVKETSCVDSAGGGCRCEYLSESDAAGTNLSGSFGIEGHVMTHHAGSMVLPSQVDFCVQGSHMTIWGHDRTNIFDLLGLRTLTLHKVVCGDGVVDRGEQCDPPDQITCSPSCQTVVTP